MMTLREARQRRLHIIRSLAREAGVSSRTVRLIEQGQRPLPVTVRKIAGALAVDPAEIVEFRLVMGLEEGR